MHRDIVPRAFVCDYTAVAHLLQQWWPSFKDHSSLDASREHKSLYNFLGHVYILKPDADAPFVHGDAGHWMLPDEPALYQMRQPNERPEGHVCSVEHGGWVAAWPWLACW